MPALRTGAYAMILALSTRAENALDGLSKQDLIALAQPHSDSSFTVPSDPSKFYTAWASMKTLEEKDLVYKFGRPTVRYALTDEGWDVAKRMKETVGISSAGITEAELGPFSTQSDNRPSHSRTSTIEVRDSAQRRSVSDSLAERCSREARGLGEPVNLDSLDNNEGNGHNEQGASKTTIRSSRESNSELNLSRVPAFSDPKVARVRTSSIDPDFLEILDSPSPEPALRPKPSEDFGRGRTKEPATRRAFMKELEERIFNSDNNDLDDVAFARALVAARQIITDSTRKTLESTSLQDCAASRKPKPTDTQSLFLCSGNSNAPMRTTSGICERPELTRLIPASESMTISVPPSRIVSGKSANHRTAPCSNPATTGIPQFEPIMIPAGSFTVELIVDTREVRTRVDREYIPSKLATLGIHCTSRAMELGDMLWVARIHDPSIKAQLELSDQEVSEVVLDYITERKRLDDLDASIKDSRFTEQKFRLKRSGVLNLIYLVEDYGSIGYMPEEQHQRLVTSITATQVIDGLFVKRTRKLDDTIAYLAQMTRLLKKRYESKPLTVIPSSVLTPQNHILLRNQGANSDNCQQATHHITYSSFASLVHKSSALTLRDVFLKMLMCTRGITGEKAIEIQRHWETPRAFVEALEDAGRDRATSNVPGDKASGATKKRDLVWSVAGELVGRRKIGKVVSARVGDIWGSEGENY